MLLIPGYSDFVWTKLLGATACQCGMDVQVLQELLLELGEACARCP